MTEGLQHSLVDKCSWKQAVELSLGVLTSLVLGTCDIHYSACTGKRTGNSCETKGPHYGRCCKHGTVPSWVEKRDSHVSWCLKWLERSVKFGLNQEAGSQKKQRSNCGKFYYCDRISHSQEDCLKYKIILG